MKKFLRNSSIASVGLLTPVLAFAQVNTGGIMNLLNQVQQIIGATIPVLIGLAVLAFSWGIVMYLFGKDKDGAKSMMIWGIIAIFVMTSVWGLVGILRSTVFGTNQDSIQNIPIPTIPR
jgi:hypothetical protein